jgi:DNA-directed RNA polymerase subunit omega
MIDELKDTSIIDKIGGRFKLSSLIQKRMIEVMEGSRPLIDDVEGMTAMEIVIEEIKQEKITADYSGPEPEPKPAL